MKQNAFMRKSDGVVRVDGAMTARGQPVASGEGKVTTMVLTRV